MTRVLLSSEATRRTLPPYTPASFGPTSCEEALVTSTTAGAGATRPAGTADGRATPVSAATTLAAVANRTRGLAGSTGQRAAGIGRPDATEAIPPAVAFAHRRLA